MDQPSAQAIVLRTNALAGLIKLPCCVRHRGAGFMAEFSIEIAYRVCAVGLGCKPLAAFCRANLDRKRQIWSAKWCGLNYVMRHKDTATYL